MNIINSEVDNTSPSEFDREEFHKETLKCNSLEDALLIYNKYKKFDLPDIEYFIASFYNGFKNIEKGKEHLINCSIYGLDFPNKF